MTGMPSAPPSRRGDFVILNSLLTLRRRASTRPTRWRAVAIPILRAFPVFRYAASINARANMLCARYCHTFQSACGETINIISSRLVHELESQGIVFSRKLAEEIIANHGILPKYSGISGLIIHARFRPKYRIPTRPYQKSLPYR